MYYKTLKGSKWVKIYYDDNPLGSSDYLIIRDYKKNWFKVDIYKRDVYTGTRFISAEFLMFNYIEYE